MHALGRVLVDDELVHLAAFADVLGPLGITLTRELYDERDDPDETRNLAAAPEFAAVVTRLSAHLPPPGPRFAKASGKSAGKAAKKAGAVE